MDIELISPVMHDGVMHERGEILKLDDQAGNRLIRLEVAVPIGKKGERTLTAMKKDEIIAELSALGIPVQGDETKGALLAMLKQERDDG